LAALVVNGFVRGTTGENRFGRDPTIHPDQSDETFESYAAYTEERPQTVARLGLVGLEWPSTSLCGVEAFWEKLRELGWIKGQNLVVEERGAHGRVERLPALMSQLIVQNVNVLLTYHTPAVVAAQRATSSIPIVAAWIGDAIDTGPATSLGPPGRNLTGISVPFANGLSGKWLQLLRETVPALSTLAVMGTPGSSWVSTALDDLETAARSQRLTLRFVEADDTEGLEQAFSNPRAEAQAVLALGEPLTMHHLRRIQSLSALHRIPTLHTNPEFTQLGGLMAYGVDSIAVLRRAADYVDKILRGASPSDLAIEQWTQYKLAVNLKTAIALGLTIPESILLRADQVIQ
jgi:putative ABC transport system substrate-binding protein